MTRLNHFDESAGALRRSRLLGVQSVAVYESGQAAIREARKLLSKVNGPVLNKEGLRG